MKLDNYNIIYQNGGINWKKLFICGSSQKEKIACKKQENDIKSALEPASELSLDDISISSIDTEELEELMKEEKPLSKEEIARRMKELEQQVDNEYNMSEVSNDPFARQLFNLTADEEEEIEDELNKLQKEVEDDLNKLTLGGGKLVTLIDSIIGSYVQILKIKIAK